MILCGALVNQCSHITSTYNFALFNMYTRGLLSYVILGREKTTKYCPGWRKKYCRVKLVSSRLLQVVHAGDQKSHGVLGGIQPQACS